MCRGGETLRAAVDGVAAATQRLLEALAAGLQPKG
jgi:hypothetical protein